MGNKRSDILNEFRVFPRMFSLLFGILLAVTANWFMSLESPNMEQAGFASTMVATAAAMFKFYVTSGPVRDTVREE